MHVRKVNQRLVIIGASARPWLQSAILAGFETFAFDFFADWDSQTTAQGASGDQGCSIKQISCFDKLLDQANQQLLGSCRAALICGGFETRIELVEKLAAMVPVLGTQFEQLRRIRESPAVFEFLLGKKVPVPDTKWKLEPHDDPTGWLRKKCGSSGGLGVRGAIPGDVVSDETDSYFQSRIEGASVSAVFVSQITHDSHVETLLFGGTEQIVGDHRLGADEFQYCGSVGPLRLPDHISVQIASIGRCLAREFEIVGLWGIDFVVREKDVIPVDLNPRMTASMELFERTLRQAGAGIRSMVDLHVKACRGQLVESEFELARQAIGDSDGTTEGKAILFHRGQLPLKISATNFAALKRRFKPTFFESIEPGFSIADIPREGQEIRTGHPILTLRIRTVRGQVLPWIYEQATEIVETLLGGD